MTLTAEEMAYDFAVTAGRFATENRIFALGWAVGLMGPYLDPDFIAEVEDSCPTDSGVYGTDGIFAGAREEGEESRGEHTAEDLFVWAHEWMNGDDSEVLP